MIRRCAHCRAEGKPYVLGVLEGGEDGTYTDGICKAHEVAVRAEYQLRPATRLLTIGRAA